MIVTAETYHVPVLLHESIDGLAIQPDGVYVDVTFGGGGHSREILRRLGPHGRLFGFDQDADAEKNIIGDERFTFVRSNFRYLSQWMRYYGVEKINGLLADLGVSSHHFDDETRGFSFRFDTPLDMRMNQRAGLTAADIVNNYSEQQLADILYLYGELKQARRIAAQIVKARARKPIVTTGELTPLLSPEGEEKRREERGERRENTTPLLSPEGEESLPSGRFGGGRGRDMARLFQALRIEVNHEMEALREMLCGACQLLAEGGRLSVITYHSLEDRMVKNMMKTGNAEGKRQQDFFGRTTAPLQPLNNKVTVPSDEEQQRNPRSRSAKLRIAVKI